MIKPLLPWFSPAIARKILDTTLSEIVRHLGTPNSSFSLSSLDVTVCVIQYYTDQWVNSNTMMSRQLRKKHSTIISVLTRPFGDQLNFARGSRKPIKRDLLNIECFNKWTHILKHLFPDT